MPVTTRSAGKRPPGKSPPSKELNAGKNEKPTAGKNEKPKRKDLEKKESSKTTRDSGKTFLYNFTLFIFLYCYMS